jgi:hypothetical protein
MVMNRIACQYAIVRFRPFVETGEFANVGVVMMAARERYFDFKLETQRHGRVTRFFDELDAKVYRAALNDLGDELERIRAVLKDNGFDRRRKDNNVELAEGLFTEIIRPRESIIRFSEPGVVLTDNPEQKLYELFGYYVERNFVTKQYRETVLERGMRTWLDELRVSERFVRTQVGNDEYQVTFPFVELRDKRPVKIMKPLYLGQDSPSKILDHCGQWVFRLDQLHRRGRMPDNVLFAVDGPNEERAQGKRDAAYRQAVEMLEERKVKVLPYGQRQDVETFVATP